MKLIIFLAAFFTTSGFYDYTLNTAGGEVINMSDYAGKKVLVVNIASTSIYAASQMEKLETLYQRHKDSLIIIGVPSNDFGNEPLGDSAILQTFDSLYHVHFPIASKSSVSGIGQIAFFHWLTSEDANGMISNPVTGDFQKFLVNKEGVLVGVFSSSEDPLETIEHAVAEN